MLLAVHGQAVPGCMQALLLLACTYIDIHATWLQDGLKRLVQGRCIKSQGTPAAAPFNAVNESEVPWQQQGLPRMLSSCQKAFNLSCSLTVSVCEWCFCAGICFTPFPLSCTGCVRWQAVI